jgi:hypothetical protein
MKPDLKITFPLGISSSRWQRRATLAAGYTAAALLPSRVAAIRNGQAGEHLSAVDRLIVSALVHRAQKRHEPLDQLAYLHRRVWESDTVTAYHAAVEERFTTWFLPHQAVVIDALERDLAVQPGRFTTLCEIGSGSGLTLDHLSRRLAATGIEHFLGLDLSVAQVEQNAQRFPACRFIAGDATQWIPAHGGSGWVYFCCGGVLEYFPQAVLLALLRHTAGQSPVRWVIVEPIDAAHDLARQPASQTFGFENTWSHNYPQLLREAGFTVLYDHDLRFHGMRWQLAMAGA